MQTTTLDFEALILQGITDAGGVPEDVILLTEDDVKSLGHLAAKRGMKQRSPDAEQPEFLPLPKDGEVFELTIDGDAVDPIGMVRGDGYNNAAQWEYKGKIIKGKQTKKFKRVGVGYQRNGDAVNTALTEHGTPADGLWREAFKKKYGLQGLTGFTGSEWVNPHGRRFFPYVLDCDSYFRYFDDGFGDYWRFVVELK